MEKGMYAPADGMIQEVVPENGKKFSLAELQRYCDGTIDVLVLPDGRELYINDNGMLEGLSENKYATDIFKKAFPIEEYPHNNGELIVGDVLFIYEK